MWIAHFRHRGEHGAAAMLLLLAATALAHRPHAVVSALLAPDDYQDTGRAWLIFSPGDATQLLRTDDYGAHWSVAGGALQADTIVGLAQDGARYLALGADGTVWVSADGARWVDHEPTGLTSSDLAVGPDVAIATTGGVWVGDPAGAMTQGLAGASVEEVAWSADGGALLARDAGGGVARSVDGGETFTTLDGLGGAATAIAELGGVPFAGTSSGAWRWEDAWVACGTLPDRDGVMPGYVTELLAGDDGHLYATTATDAYFVSDDGCATWTFVDTGLGASYGGIGGVSDADQTYTGLVVGARNQLVAGFDGIAWSTDGGETWGTAPVVSIDRARGLALAPGFPTAPRLFVGTYGGGVAWTDDGGQTWHGSNRGLAGPYNFSLLADPGYATNRTVWWAGGQPDPAAVSADDGETWITVSPGSGSAVRVFAEAGIRYLVLIDNAGAGRLYRSRDGAAWELVSTLNAALEGAVPSQLRERGSDASRRMYVAADNPSRLLASDDGGATWRALATWDDGKTAGLELWHTRILHATENGGLHRSDDGGETWITSTTPVPRPRSLAMDGDGTLYLVGGDGQVWRSEDGGDSWTQAGEPLVSSPGLVVPSTEVDGLVLVGTAQGVYWSVDAGDTWERLPRFQRFAMNGTRLGCDGPCAAWDDGAGALDDAWDLTELDVVTFSFEGTALRPVYDVLAGTPYWDVTVDGAAARTDATAEWLVSDLPMGWHEVSLRVAGGNARLHAVEAIAPGSPLPYWLPPTDTGDTGDTSDTRDTSVDHTGEVDDDTDRPDPREPRPKGRCMCGATGAASGWGLVWMGLVALRARRTRM